MGFVLFFTLLAFAVALMLTRTVKNGFNAHEWPVSIFSLIFVAGISVALLLLPYVKSVYLRTESQIELSQNYNRPYEDFFTFSLRPWYFLTPSPKNPIYNEFSKSITQKVADTGYFLADDYFPAEHSGAFYGYLLLATFFVLLYFGLFKSSKELRPKIWTLFLTIVMVLTITMPPFFTIAGIQIYTPGWLVYKFFPMFRVTARFAIVILLLMLMIMAEVITENYEKWKKFLKYFVPVLLVVTLAETFVPFKIEKYDTAPVAYNYMSSQEPMSINFAVYPYDESNEALFWLPTHKQCLMNVRDNNYPDISSAELTKKIYLPEGLEKAKEYNINYVLVFGDETNYAKFTDPAFVIDEDFGDSRLYKIQ